MEAGRVHVGVEGDGEELSRLIAEQRSDDSHVQRSEVSEMASFDKTQGYDEANPSTLHDSIGVQVDIERELRLEAALDVDPLDSEYEPQWFGRVHRVNNGEGWPPLLKVTLRGKDADEFLLSVFESFLWWQRFHATRFTLGKGRRPKGEKLILASWFWQLERRGIPRPVLEIVSGRSSTSVAELINWREARSREVQDKMRAERANSSETPSLVSESDATTARRDEPCRASLSQRARTAPRGARRQPPFPQGACIDAHAVPDHDHAATST